MRKLARVKQHQCVKQAAGESRVMLERTAVRTGLNLPRRDGPV